MSERVDEFQGDDEEVALEQRVDLLRVEVYRQGGLFFAEWKPANLLAVGPSPQDALWEFAEELERKDNTLSGMNDEELSAELLAEKQALDRVFES